MVNQNKVNDPRQWNKWVRSGAVGTIEGSLVSDIERRTGFNPITIHKDARLSRISAAEMINYSDELSAEIALFMLGGADYELADKMARVFTPLEYSPVTGKLNERVRQADDGGDFSYLAFDMLLKGEIELAREYMKRAVEIDPDNAGFGRQQILDNIELVQNAVTFTKRDFNRLRKQLFENKPLEAYLK